MGCLVWVRQDWWRCWTNTNWMRPSTAQMTATTKQPGRWCGPTQQTWKQEGKVVTRQNVIIFNQNVQEGFIDNCTSTREDIQDSQNKAPDYILFSSKKNYINLGKKALHVLTRRSVYKNTLDTTIVNVKILLDSIFFPSISLWAIVPVKRSVQQKCCQAAFLWEAMPFSECTLFAVVDVRTWW